MLGLPLAIGAPPFEGGGFQHVMIMGEHADVLDADTIGDGHWNSFPSLRGAKRRSNPVFTRASGASRSLSSGAHSRDPLTRNDDAFQGSWSCSGEQSSTAPCRGS